MLIPAVVVLGVSAVTGYAGTRLAATHSVQSGGITKVIAVTDNAGFSTQSTTPVDISGATAKIDIPSGTQGFIVVQFAAEAKCGTELARGCLVKAMLNGSDMAPGQVSFANDGNPSGAHEMTWSSPALSPGAYTVQLQAFLGGLPQPGFSLGPWHLTTERVKV